MLLLLLSIACLLLGAQAEFYPTTPVGALFNNYVALSMLDTGEVYAAGFQVSGGTVISSADMGATWSIIGTDATFQAGLYGIAVRRLGDGIARYMVVDADGGIFTFDGSSSWSNVQYVPGALVGVTIGSNGNAFVSGSGGIVYTSTSGTAYGTWTDVSPPMTPGLFLYDVNSLDGTNVIAVGAGGTIVYSSDAGSSWALATSGTGNAVYCISQLSLTLAMVAGENGYLAKSTNAGLTWTTMTAFPSTYTSRFHAISILSTSVAYVVASPSSGASGGRIYETFNGGASWALIQTTSSSLFSVSIYNSIYGIVGAAPGTAIYRLVPGTAPHLL